MTVTVAFVLFNTVLFCERYKSCCVTLRVTVGAGRPVAEQETTTSSVVFDSLTCRTGSCSSGEKRNVSHCKMTLVFFTWFNPCNVKSQSYYHFILESTKSMFNRFIQSGSYHRPWGRFCRWAFQQSWWWRGRGSSLHPPPSHSWSLWSCCAVHDLWPPLCLWSLSSLWSQRYCWSWRDWSPHPASVSAMWHAPHFQTVGSDSWGEHLLPLPPPQCPQTGLQMLDLQERTVAHPDVWFQQSTCVQEQRMWVWTRRSELFIYFSFMYFFLNCCFLFLYFLSLNLQK